MAQSYIRWKKDDYKALRSAITRFNNKLKRVESGTTILPEKLNYKDVKASITTRQELNRTLNSLRSFVSDKSSILPTKLDSGIEVTRWEKRELGRLKRTAVRNLNKELSGLTQTLGTGNTRINEIKSTLESLEGWQKADTTQFNRLRKRIKYLGKSDLEMQQAKIFQRNFIKAYSKMGRSEIVEVAKSYKNPLKFWEFIKESELIDIQLSYDQSAHLIRLNMDADDTYYYELFKLGIML